MDFAIFKSIFSTEHPWATASYSYPLVHIYHIYTIK